MHAPTLSLAELDTLLTVNDLVQKLRVTRRSIYLMIADGRLPQPMKLGRNLYWKPTDVDAALTEMARRPRAKKNPDGTLEASPSGSP